MDESWRMKMGLNVDPFFSIAPRSMDVRIDAQDFSDVFGGPPRSVLTRKFSGDFSRSDCFYDEIFRPPGMFSCGTVASSKSHGKNIPAFRIPSGGDGFYDGVFGGCSGTAKQSPIAKSRKPHFGGSRRSSPETLSLDPHSFRRMDDFGPSSPASSPVSSFIREEEYETEEKQRTSKAEDEDEEEMSSYVIEVNSDRFDRYRDGGSGGGNSDSNDMDEAIAWARERSQRPETKQAQEDLIDSRRSEEEEAKSEEVMEMEMKDEEIRIWLTGKEINIRLLLSTLHHVRVLWSNSIWQAIPLANLRDGSQVKKAYQKARLCLHPDKLQQRGGTSPLQKSVASRVFSILQEAWAVYLTNEGLSG
ncbi:hypothetical protein DY000_02047517 [Brassica cretica]|uniref:J domain-containing protein n=2 Tax=Brassica cretica TaxID=69181 RepID=A0ABQ7EQ16_BRACR|nr:hypothetical protein DY000_02047517 [Brassica cretica]